MYEKTNFLCFLMQRYAISLSRQNPFNESPCIFSETYDLYFVSTSPVRERSNSCRQ